MRGPAKLIHGIRPERAPRLVLPGERVYLRPPRSSDWRQWSALREESREFLEPWEPKWSADSLTRRAFRRRVRLYNADWRRDQGAAFLIFRREDHALLGGITLSNVRRGVVQSGTLGYWIGAPHAQKGYMSEALGAVLNDAFGRLALHRVEAACLPENEASRRLLTKLGFEEEGYAREYLRINGAWRDHVLFAILRRDRSGT